MCNVHRYLVLYTVHVVHLVFFLLESRIEPKIPYRLLCSIWLTLRNLILPFAVLFSFLLLFVIFMLYSLFNMPVFYLLIQCAQFTFSYWIRWLFFLTQTQYVLEHQQQKKTTYLTCRQIHFDYTCIVVCSLFFYIGFMSLCVCFLLFFSLFFRLFPFEDNKKEIFGNKSSMISKVDPHQKKKYPSAM